MILIYSYHYKRICINFICYLLMLPGLGIKLVVLFYCLSTCGLLSCLEMTGLGLDSWIGLSQLMGYRNLGRSHGYTGALPIGDGQEKHLEIGNPWNLEQRCDLVSVVLTIKQG